MEHSFNVDVAIKYGVNSAILLNNIYFWVKKNMANEVHIYEGKCWTYNSVKAFSELFPYLTEKQVRTSLDTLVENGLLLKGNYNKMKMDRTTWYTLSNKGFALLGDCHVWQNDLPCMANANDLDGKAIPNNKTQILNTDIKLGPDESDILSQETKDTIGSDVLEEEKYKGGKEGADRAPVTKPKRSYNTKPLMQMEVENKKLTRQQKQHVKIKELLDLVPTNWNKDLVNILGEYLDMRINLHVGKIDEVWFQNELNDNIYPALRKHSEQEVINFIRTVVIPRQYKRCFISISSGEPKRNNFNDISSGYTKDELEEAERIGRLAKEEAIKNGTYRHEF